ncbi:unnamed protein product, partial [Effrenium voratum]
AKYCGSPTSRAPGCAWRRTPRPRREVSRPLGHGSRQSPDGRAGCWRRPR